MQRNVAAVIVNYEGGELLLDCIASLQAQAVAEIVLVDNGSADGSAAAAAARFPDVKLVQPGRNTGFAGGANLGAREARAALLLFLNPDIRLPPGSVAAMAARFADPRVGVLAPPLQVETSGTVEYGATVDVIGAHVGLTTPAPPVYVSGCALMTRASLFSELGGFDDRFFMFVEDVDYCWRALLSRLRGHRARHRAGVALRGRGDTGGLHQQPREPVVHLVQSRVTRAQHAHHAAQVLRRAACGGGDSPLRRAEPPDRRRLGCPRPPSDRARHARRLPVESARAAADARVAAARSGVPQGAGHADPPADVPRCVEAAPAEAVRRSPGVGGWTRPAWTRPPSAVPTSHES